MLRPEARCLVRIASLAVILLIVSGCGPDPKLDFIRPRPENDLVYPGAKLLSSETYSGSGLLAGEASIDRQFSSGASTKDILDWYRTELSKRKWTGGVEWGDSVGKYADGAGWTYPGLFLELDFYAPADGTVRYRMHFSSSPEYVVAAQIESLREMPEAALAPSSARQPGAVSSWWDSWWNEAVPGTGGSLIRVERNYVSDSTPSEIARYYETELAVGGWKSTSPPATDPRGAPPHLVWQKGSVTALLFWTRTYETNYEFALDETLDSAGSPVAP